MDLVKRLYRKENYTFQKSINIEDKLYTKLKYIVNYKYDTTMSEVINMCIENLIKQKKVKYYDKPQDEIMIYRSIMIRKENWEGLKSIKNKNGITITRLINIAIKEFVTKHE